MLVAIIDVLLAKYLRDIEELEEISEPSLELVVKARIYDYKKFIEKLRMIKRCAKVLYENSDI